MRRRSRAYLTSVLQLDIRVLQRHGILHGGAWATLRWDAVTTATVTAKGSSVHVAIQLEHATIESIVDLTFTWTGIGNRGWWICPTCSRRCAILFLQDQLACRECSHLHYATQSAGFRRRALLKANKLRALYGADPDLPNRPRWMRQAKFVRRMQEAEAALVIAMPFARQ